MRASYDGQRQLPTGSRPYRYDPRDEKFELTRHVGAPNLSQLPKDGLYRPLRPVENQGSTLRCGAYSSAVSNGYLRKLRFHPDWQAKKIGQIQGHNVDEYGSEPRAVMKAMADNGSLFYELCGTHLETDGVSKSGNWASYPDTLDVLAQPNRISGYFAVKATKAMDTFDAIKNALFVHYDPRTGMGSVVHAFSPFYQEWVEAKDGIIKDMPIANMRFIGDHTGLFVDWAVNKDGVEYLIYHNSWGADVGAKGFFFFPREVVNRIFAMYGTALKIPTGILTPEMIAEAKKETVLGLLIRKFLFYAQIASERFGTFLHG